MKKIDLKQVLDIPKELQPPFDEALKNKSLKLRDTAIFYKIVISDKEVVDLIVPFLNKNPQITDLDISHNYLYTDYQYYIGYSSVQALINVPTLKILNISQNGLTDNELKMFANTTTLEVLDISSNNFSGAGTKELKDTIDNRNESLQKKFRRIKMIFLSGMDVKHGNGPLLQFSKALTNGKANMRDKNEVGSTLPKLVEKILEYAKPPYMKIIDI